MKVYYVDIDETICKTPTTRKYEDAIPIKENIKKINKLYEQGHTIVYWTARGSRKQINWYDLTKKQLTEWNAKHHELRTDKPYYDLFIDDRCTNINDL